MKLQFVEIKKRNGQEEKKVLLVWDNVPESKVPCVCENFMQGFLYAMGECKRNVRYPSVMVMDGWSAQTWRWHDSDSGTRWEFENGRGQYIIHWDRRAEKRAEK